MGQRFRFVCLQRSFAFSVTGPRAKKVKNKSQQIERYRKEGKVWFMHLNIRSIDKNFEELMLYVEGLENKPSVLCLSETWDYGTIIPELYQIPGYKVPFVNKGENRNGGVALYILSSIKGSELSTTSKINCTTVELDFDSMQIRVACIYNSPSSNKNEFVVELSKYLSSFENTRVPFYILGDINIDLMSNNSISKTYVNEMSIHGFSQELYEPTRCFGQSATLLDHIFHNDVLPAVTSGIMDIGVTDHHATFIEVPISLKSENRK